MDPDRVRANLERVREAIGPDVEVLAAIKYLDAADLPALAEGGVTVVGENRAQELAAKQDEHGDLFEPWDFIGALQSRKVKDVAPRVRLIHSVASESALKRLEDVEVLIQVNVAGEEGKAGIPPERAGRATSSAARCRSRAWPRCRPFVERAEDNRRHFARLAELAAEHGLSALSMGTSQDYEVAAQEGATIVRLGSVAIRPRCGVGSPRSRARAALPARRSATRPRPRPAARRSGRRSEYSSATS